MGNDEKLVQASAMARLRNQKLLAVSHRESLWNIIYKRGCNKPAPLGLLRIVLLEFYGWVGPNTPSSKGSAD